MMPKKIYIVRHAKSSWVDFNLTDFERPLDERGQRDAPVMANYLKSRGVLPDFILSSPAVRAKSTAEIFANVFQKTVNYADNLYHGYPEDYLEHITGLSEAVKCIIIFGHNPGITYMANLVEADSTDNVSTCGVLELSMKSSLPWETADWQKMTLDNIFSPKGI